MKQDNRRHTPGDLQSRAAEKARRARQRSSEGICAAPGNTRSVERPPRSWGVARRSHQRKRQGRGRSSCTAHAAARHAAEAAAREKQLQAAGTGTTAKLALGHVWTDTVVELLLLNLRIVNPAHVQITGRVVNPSLQAACRAREILLKES